MRRTQLYLDDNLWSALHVQARKERTTISSLVRQAVRDRYLGNLNERNAVMEAFIGSMKRSGPEDPTEYVRSLRHGTRMERLETHSS
jgi:hypothetical protein